MASPPTSPYASNTSRRGSNPFTRNQDSVDSVTKAFRRQSFGDHSTFSDTIDEEEDGDVEDDQLKIRPAQVTAVGAGTGDSLKHGPSDVDGIPIKPTLNPAGGGRRHLKVGSMEDPDIVYGEERQKLARTTSDNAAGVAIHNRSAGINRTYSMAQQKRRPVVMNDDRIIRQRRLSHDAVQESPRRFIVDVEETMRLVLEQEDTDGNFQICVTDSGPKVLSLGTATSNGYKGVDIRGTYMLSNLLQELALAREHGRKRIVLDESRLTENPVDRLSRMISQTFWHNLTRRIDAGGLERILSDPKNRSKQQAPRIFIPRSETKQIEYYQKFADEHPDFNLTIEILPEVLTADYTRDLNEFN